MGQEVGRDALLKVSFLFIIIVSIISGISTLGIYTWYRIAYHRLIAQNAKRLEMHTTVIAREIIEFVLQQHEALAKLSSQEIVRSAYSNPSNLNQLEQFIKGQDSIDYKCMIFLTLDSTVFFTIRTKDLVGKKIFSRTNPSFFAQSLIRSIMAETFDVSVFAIDPLLSEPALFICEPVIDNKKLIGILAIQLDDKNIYRFLSFKGLGETGEILVGQQVQDGAMIIAPTRHNPDIAFSKDSICHKNSCPLLYRAVLGEQNTGIAVRYQSQKLIGSWRYIPIVNWGLVVSQEIKELTKNLILIDVLYYFFFCITLLFIVWGIFYYFVERKRKNQVNIDSQ